MRHWQVNRILLLSGVICAVALSSSVASARQQINTPSDTTITRTLTSEGTEFWLCFMKNFRERDPEKPGTYEPAVLEVFLTADDDADVQLEIPSLGFRHRLRVPAGAIRNVQITPEAELDTFPRPQARALRITSDRPVTVYALNHRIQTTDTYLVLPIGVLGKEYRALCYSKLSAALAPIFAIVATEDDTRIEITPTSPTTDGHNAGERYTVVLDRGQAYQVRASFASTGSGDLTGTAIVASKPIAVFSGHTCAYVPPGVKACNHLVEQLPPVSTWGKHYFLGRLQGRSKYTFRILAAFNGTRVFKNQSLIAVLDAGEYYEEPNETANIQLTADKPILVAQYAQGFANGDQVGDPMMILVSPTQQFVRRYRIATPIQGQWNHYANIIAREEALGTIRLDGQRISRNLFERIGVSSYFIAAVRLDYGAHTIEGDEPFGLYSYGFGYGYDGYDAYGTMGGQSFLLLDTLRDRLPPTTAFSRAPNGKALHVVARDDRSTDRGLASIEPLLALNMRAYLPRIEAGQPQAEFDVHPLDPEQDGQLTLRITDVAGNSTTVTYTYCFNPMRGSFEFITSDQCPPQRPWTVTLAGIASAIYHTASFRTTGDLAFERATGNAYGSALSVGALVSYALDSRLRLRASLSLEPFGRGISAPDSTLTAARLSNDTLIAVQAETILSPRLPLLALGLGVEWTLFAHQVGTRRYEMFACGGGRITTLLSSQVTLERHFVLPSPAASESAMLGDAQHRTLSTLRTINAELWGGIGFVLPIPQAPRWSALLQVQYTYPLGSILRDAEWSVERLQALLGVRYSF